MESKIYQVLRKHRLPLKKREELMPDLLALFSVVLQSKSLRIVSDKCVNSNWVADWVAMEGQEHCQCIVGCKIKVEFSQNGHKPYPYIVDQLEYQKLVDKIKK